MNFSRLSVRNVLFVSPLALLVLSGCGGGDAAEFERGTTALELGDLKKAERCFEACVASAPQDVERVLYLARTELALGEIVKAQELAQRALTLDPAAGDVRLLAAQIAYHAKDEARSAELFSALAAEAHEPAAVRAEALAGLGVVEMSRGNLHLARIAFLRALQLDRRNAAARYHLGLLYRDGLERNGSGYLESALEQFEFFVRLEAESSPRVQQVQRTVIPAVKDAIAKAAASRPGVSKRDSAASAAHMAKADAAFKKGTFKTALKSYQDALTADPLSYPAALGLAKCLEKTETTRDGLLKTFEAYRTACTLRPGATAVYLTTGALALRIGQAAQAVEIYSRAVAFNPTSLDAIDGLIRALRKTGSRNSVANAYQAYRDSVVSKKR